MEEDVQGLNELSNLSNEVEKRLQGELPRRVSVDVSGDPTEESHWNQIDVRIVDPEDGIIFEREYSELPTADTVLEDYHNVQ
jgi:hypothetical protein